MIFELPCYMTFDFHITLIDLENRIDSVNVLAMHGQI